MTTTFTQITSVPALDKFLATANGAAAILFKHSNSCGVSATAYREMAKLREPVGLITVQLARQVSDEIEERWGIDHETPQVLVIRDGKVVWDASHFGVKARAVEAALVSEARP